jgi:hypothetical protein
MFNARIVCPLGRLSQEHRDKYWHCESDSHGNDYRSDVRTVSAADSDA